jgi:hypothetical protein
MDSKSRNIFGFLLIIMVVLFFWVLAYGGVGDKFDPVVGTNVVSQLQRSPADMLWFSVKDITGAGEIWTYGFSEDYLFGWIQNCPKHKTWHVILYMGGSNMVHLSNKATRSEAKLYLEGYAWKMYKAAVERYDDSQ